MGDPIDFAADLSFDMECGTTTLTAFFGVVFRAL
jgi:hypothetical protein